MTDYAELIKVLRYQAKTMLENNCTTMSAEQSEDAAAAIETLAAEVARLQAVDMWIPITEKLPQKTGYYLTSLSRKASEEFGGNSTSIKIMRFMGEDWRYAHHFPEWINSEIKDTVTHWMPLPKKPKWRGDAAEDNG